MRSQPRSRPSPEPLQQSSMRLLITGGTGVLGRALRPLAEAAGHELAMPGREELDLFDPAAVGDAMRDVDGVLHLATRIRSLDQISYPEAWHLGDFGATLHVGDAGRALLSALSLPSGIYNVCRDGERVSHRRFTEATGWRPRH